jgi:hypothetical protein
MDSDWVTREEADWAVRATAPQEDPPAAEAVLGEVELAEPDAGEE